MVYKKKITSLTQMPKILKALSKKKKIPVSTLKRRTRVTGESVLIVDV